MKYIRTLYGKLFGVAGLSKTGKSVFYISKKSGKQCQMPRNCGDRISDTIEELCDQLVLKDLETGMCFVMFPENIKDIKDNWRNLMDNDYLKNHTIYGAIWTNKGLIYVAKMNEKGELCLI